VDIQDLIREMYAAPREEAYVLCRRLLRKTLADGLGPEAWHVLEAIADLDVLWTWKELPKLLEEFRVPSTREKLQDAIAQKGGTGQVIDDD
jgi:hypothetical protein